MAGWIILGVVLLFWLLLQLSVTAYLRWGEETEVKVGVAGWKTTVYPTPPKPQHAHKEKPPKKRAKKMTWKEQLNEMLSRDKDQSFGEFIEMIFGILGKLWPSMKAILSRLRIEKLSYTLEVGSADAHQTALLYAGLYAGFYQVLATLQGNLKVSCEHIDIRPSFTTDHIRQQGQMKLKLRLSSLLWHGLKMLWQLIKIVLQNRKPVPTTKS